MDTKETTNSSILVARSKEGYQKNRLETPVWFLYSHWSNQLVFTKLWYIRYHHLRPQMERLDTKSSMHTKHPFILSIFTPILDPEVSKAQTLRAGLFHKILFYVCDLFFLLNPIPGTRSGNKSAPEISLKCQLTTSFWFLFAITIHQKSHPNFDCWLVFDHGSP